ncbi:MAG: hypothetical protein RBT73_10045 [Spirochaetia bacterium]|nr:hypothetical protein [Spirochaetia bacterium]
MADTLLGAGSISLKKSKMSLFASLELSLISVINYLRYILAPRSRKPEKMFIGAGSGLFANNGKTMDSYYPYKEFGASTGPYWLSADFPERMLEFKRYLLENKVVVFSFLSAPLAALIDFSLRSKKYLSESVATEKLLRYLASRNLALSLETLERLHRSYIARYWAFRILLAPLRISEAFLVSAYTYSEVCMLMKERGINVSEIQHGLIGRTHSGYNYRIKDARLPTPNRIFVYDEFWKNELLLAGYYSEDAISVTGRLKYDAISKEKPSPLKLPFVVITGQGVFTDRVIEFMKKAILDQKERKNKCAFVYIPHPNESSDTANAVRTALGSLSAVGKADGYTTEEYIFHSVAHVSIYSSCHFDAIHLLGKTYILDVMEGNPMADYIKSNPEAFVPITDASQIEEIKDA